MFKKAKKSKKNDSNPNDEVTLNNETTSAGPAEHTPLAKDSENMFVNKVTIPEAGNGKFSFRKLWAFTGPGFLTSIGYLDPGNIESDLQCGSIAKYGLLWVLFSATALSLIMQRLAARLGVVSGLHLAEMCHQQYKQLPRLALWIMVEIAIISSDMQEVIGTAIAIYLLSHTRLPIWAGVLITIVDTFTFLFLDKRLRRLEMVFGLFITVMAATFGYEYIISSPDQLAVIKGIFVPICEGCDSRAVLQGVAVVGAVIMPHNLYLHSALVKSRNIDRLNKQKIKEANMYFLIEAGTAVLLSFIINLFVVAVFADGLHKVTNRELINKCSRYPSVNGSVFPNNDDFVVSDLYKGGIFLGCTYGAAAMYIWGVGILAAGQSSTMTGTYAGQFAMDGFLNLQWARWLRVLVTRSIAIMPTFCVAFFTHLEELTGMNDLMNVLNCVLIPFGSIPLIAFTSNSRIMGEFVNSWIDKTVSILLSIVVIGINTYFVIFSIREYKFNVAILTLIAVISVMYLLFCIYLVIHMALSMGNFGILEYGFVKKYIYSSSMAYSSFPAT